MQRILLAEDDGAMRGFLERELARAGYEVEAFDNGASAYARLRQEPFDLILTDVVMPEMDGVELARRACEHDPDRPVIFITGFAAVRLHGQVERPNNTTVLSKPFHLRQLVDEVGRVLATAAARVEH
ncbi:MAG: response regulator [Pseudomonadota bacterium]